MTEWTSDEFIRDRADDPFIYDFGLYEGPEIKRIRAEIFRLAKRAPDLETMHWYMWLDECFECDEFCKEDFPNLQWRAWVLQQKGEPVGLLLNMIRPILVELGCIDEEGQVPPHHH